MRREREEGEAFLTLPATAFLLTQSLFHKMRDSKAWPPLSLLSLFFKIFFTDACHSLLLGVSLSSLRGRPASSLSFFFLHASPSSPSSTAFSLTPFSRLHFHCFLSQMLLPSSLLSHTAEPIIRYAAEMPFLLIYMHVTYTAYIRDAYAFH